MPGDEGPLAAGDFAAWLTDMQAALREERPASVPCGDCTACCTSAQFIHIDPDETGALAHIPKPLLFPAPGLPKGRVLMGYDEHGHCPMFQDNACSIYEHRPRTCRTYDCRIFPATGLVPDQPAIAARAARWLFTYSSEDARARHSTLQGRAADCAGAPTPRAVRALIADPLPREP